MRPEFIPVGTVVNAHGIRGEVKVNPAGFDPEFIASFKTLYIGGQPTAVKSAGVHKSTVLRRGGGCLCRESHSPCPL